MSDAGPPVHLLPPARPGRPAGPSALAGPARPGRVGVPAVLLLLLGALMSVGAAGALAYRSVARDRRSWVDLLGPLHDRPAVARSLARKFAEAVAARPGVALTSAQQQAVEDATATLIARPDFGSSWDGVVIDAQAQTLALASASGSASGTVVLHLSPLVELVRSEASARGIALGSLPPTAGDVVVISDDNGGQVRRGYRLLDQAVVALSALTVAFLGLGLAVARNRWRAATVGGAFVGLAAAVAAFGGIAVLHSVAAGLAKPGDAAAARLVADAAARPFVEAMMFLGLAGVAITVVGTVIGAAARRRHQSFG